MNRESSKPVMGELVIMAAAALAILCAYRYCDEKNRRLFPVPVNAEKISAVPQNE